MNGDSGDNEMTDKDRLPLISTIPIHPPISRSHTQPLPFGYGYAALYPSRQ